MNYNELQLQELSSEEVSTVNGGIIISLTTLGVVLGVAGLAVGAFAAGYAIGADVARNSNNLNG